MSAMQIAYRDVDRTPLLYVLRDEAARHEGLEVEIRQVQDGDAFEQGFLKGEFDLICEHLRFLFPARLEGHPVRILANCSNASTELLLAHAGIGSVEDLAGKTIALRATPSSRMTADYWLKHLGLADRAVTLVVSDEEIGRWQQWRKVATGEADAVICSPLYAEAPLAAGLHKIEASPLPELGSLFLAALAPLVETRLDDLQRLVRALYRAMHTFRTKPEAALSIMRGEPARLMGLKDDDEVRHHYELLRAEYDPKPIPTPEAIANSFAMLNEGYQPMPDLNPLSLWDLRFILELEDQRFMESLN
jgi:ABC-type nitrate/sulfonate/bicarbonate transport system substrate-binding protein